MQGEPNSNYKIMKVCFRPCHLLDKLIAHCQAKHSFLMMQILHFSYIEILIYDTRFIVAQVLHALFYSPLCVTSL